MRIYFAAPFARQVELRDVAKEYEAAGHTITASWLYEPVLDADDPAREWGLKVRALEDDWDVAHSDAVVLFTDGPQITHGGMHVEVGLAIARGIPVYVNGPKVNVFHRHPLVHDISELDRGEIVGYTQRYFGEWDFVAPDDLVAPI
jgi:nucleoside 2-deoxyribosyltransferase